MRTKRLIGFAILPAVVMAFLVISPSRAATRPVNSDTGIFTSVEPDGFIVIDKKEYRVSPTIRVYDGLGKRVALDELTLPVAVYVEFDYTRRGAEIKLLKVTPR